MTAFIALSALLLFPVPAQEPGPIDLQRAAQFFKEAQAASNADGGELWGSRLYGPILFVDRVSLYVVANQQDKEGQLKPSGGVWVGTLPDNVAPANTAVKWAGVHWTMVMWPLPELPHSRMRLLMHECFHRIQDDLGLPATNPNNAHLDDKDGRTWMRLEMRALAEALSNADEARTRAIRDALAFRKRRAELCGPISADFERQLEMNEGLCEYTGIVLSGFGKPSLDARAAMRLEQEQASATFSRSFAYATGPAYGLLLDGFGVAWRKGLNPATSLPDLLARSLPKSPGPEEPISALVARYDGDRVIAVETQAAEDRERLLASYRAKFVEGPLLTLPVLSKFGYSYDPNAVSSFPGHGQVFSSAKVTDEWGVLQVSGGGVLMQRGDQAITGVVVTAPQSMEGVRVAGDGWTLELSVGWRVVPGLKPGSFRLQRAT
jgi:hypothetical protein